MTNKQSATIPTIGSSCRMSLTEILAPTMSQPFPSSTNQAGFNSSMTREELTSTIRAVLELISEDDFVDDPNMVSAPTAAAEEDDPAVRSFPSSTNPRAQ